MRGASGDGDTFALQAAATPDAERIAPLALYFSTGHSQNDHANCLWELQTADADPNEHYVIGRLPAVDLVGHTHSAVSGPPTCRYAIGLLDEGTRVLKYAEIQAGQVVRVEPRARSIQYEATEAGASQSALDREKQLAQSRRLVDAFGSTRRKRQLKQRDNAQVQVGAIGASEAVASLLQTAGDTAVAAGATKAEVIEKAMGYRILPPHNPQATKPGEAYKLVDLEPQGIWEMLDTQAAADLLQDPDTTKIDSMTEFLQQRWRQIRDPTSTEAKEVLKGSAYLLTALRIYAGSNTVVSNPMRGGLRTPAEKFNLHVEVLQGFLDSFYDASEREGSTFYSKSDQKKTLLLMHILVTGLILHGYMMGPRHSDLLRQAVKLTPAQFSSMYREMGCVVRSNAVKGIATANSPARDLSIVLLPPSTTPHLPPKKLADYFPIIKLDDGAVRPPGLLVVKAAAFAPLPHKAWLSTHETIKSIMGWSDIIRVRYPEPEELAEKERQKVLAEKLREESGEKELNDLQTKVADCFLDSWIFAAAGAGIGLASGYQRKSYLPLAYGVMGGTIVDIASGCVRCRKEWQALQAKYREMKD